VWPKSLVGVWFWGRQHHHQALLVRLTEVARWSGNQIGLRPHPAPLGDQGGVRRGGDLLTARRAGRVAPAPRGDHYQRHAWAGKNDPHGLCADGGYAASPQVIRDHPAEAASDQRESGQGPLLWLSGCVPLKPAVYGYPRTHHGRDHERPWRSASSTRRRTASRTTGRGSISGA
jgi:hypothetical protein